MANQVTTGYNILRKEGMGHNLSHLHFKSTGAGARLPNAACKGSPVGLAPIQTSAFIQTKLTPTAFITENDKHRFQRLHSVFPFSKQLKKTSARALQCLHLSYWNSCRNQIKVVEPFLATVPFERGTLAIFLQANVLPKSCPNQALRCTGTLHQQVQPSLQDFMLNRINYPICIKKTFLLIYVF